MLVPAVVPEARAVELRLRAVRDDELLVFRGRGRGRVLLGPGRLVGAPLPEDVLEVGLLEVAAPALLEAEGDLPFRLEDLVDEHGPGVAVAAHLRLVLAGGAERGEGEWHLPCCCFACLIALIAVIGGFASLIA